jgi:hypothetical protein
MKDNPEVAAKLAGPEGNEAAEAEEGGEGPESAANDRPSKSKKAG